jgi:hypothetical protein
MVRSLNRLLSALVMSLLALAGGAQAADVEGALRATSRLMLDGNAPRDFTLGGDTTDLVLSLLASGEGRATSDRWQLVGRYDAGGRKYLVFPGEDTLVQSAALEGSLALGTSLGVGVEGRAKDRRGGRREYTDLAASAFLEYAPDARLSLRLRAGAHRFLYRPSFSASFGGPEVGLLARYRLDRRHAVFASGEYGARRYSALALAPPTETVSVPQPRSWRREDGALQASVGYTYKGPLALGLTYTFQEIGSNSFGESVQRHRLSGNAGVRLPWKLMLMAQGTLGLNHYPDGVYFSTDITLLEDDEAQNSLSLKLVRPLDEHLDVELSYAMYGTRLPRNDLAYFRQVAGVGLTWRL